MEKRNYFELDVNAPIFEELSKLPTWWQQILKDKDLYVNVRKDNRIFVYYRGAAVMKGLHCGRTGLTCQIDKEYQKGWFEEADGNSLFPVEKIVENIELIKKNIEEYYKKESPKPEGMSEKEIQGDMYINPEKYRQQRYIDTEYAYNYDDKRDENGNLVKIRIDFITITSNGLIEFVELKRISDNRLLTKEYKEKKEKCSKDDLPDICDQMGKYTTFIQEHEERIVTYYKKVQTIMRNIGVNNPLANISIKGVKPEARLLFAPYSVETKYSKGKKERIECIKDLMESQHINSNISDVLESFLKKRPTK